LEPYFREKARKRQEATRLVGKGIQKKDVNGGGTCSTTIEKGKTRHQVAEALGISGKHWERIKTIYENEEKYPDIVKKSCKIHHFNFLIRVYFPQKNEHFRFCKVGR